MVLAPSPPETAHDAEAAAAARVRSALVASDSLVVSTEDYTAELTGRHEVDADGHLVLDVPPGSGLVRALVESPDDDLPATVSVTDVAPVAVRERVRARATLAGWLGTASADQAAGRGWRLRLDVAHVCVEEGGGVVLVDPDVLAAVAPDPLARVEAEQLLHLDAAHADTVALLGRLVGAHRRRSAVRIRPLRLDRDGFVLRLERSRTYEDVRVAFDAPVTTETDLAAAVHRLVARAASCARRGKGARG